MQPSPSRMLVVILAVLWIACGEMRAAIARESDAIGDRLAAARVAYEDQLQKLRERAIDAIENLELKERSSDNPRLDVLASIIADREQFELAGAWPGLPFSAPLQRQATKISGAMIEAFKQAKKQYVREKNDAMARVIDAELTQFINQNDLICWSEGLEGETDGSPTKIGGENVSFDLGYEVGEEFRLEIIAKCVEGSGTLIVEVPLPGGKALEVRPVISDQSVVRLLLSLRESGVSADLGVTRPIDLSRTVEGGRTLNFRCESGAFEIETIRTKRIVTGKIEPQAKQNKPQRQSRAPVVKRPKAEEWLPAKANYRGNRQGQDDKDQSGCTAVLTRSGKTVSIRVDHGNQVLHFDCTLSGDDLTLKEVRPGRASGGTIRDARGSGRITKDRIRLVYRYLHDGQVKNRLVEGSLRLSKQD